MSLHIDFFLRAYLRIYMGPGHEMWKQYLLESPMLEYNILGGETMLITDDWDHFDNISLHDVIGRYTCSDGRISTGLQQV